MVQTRVWMMIVVSGWVMSPLMATAAPADVALVTKIHQGLTDAAQRGQQGQPPPGLVEVVHQEVMAVAKEMLRDKGIWGRARIRLQALEDALRKELTERIGGVLKEADAGKRRDRAHQLLREVTTHRFVENQIARWLGFPSLGELAGQGRAQKPGSLGSQVVFKTNKGALRVNSKKAVLLRDVGGAGSGNSVVDVGEWVKLGVHLKNSSSLPFFSSSAWVRSKDPCLWSDVSLEHPLSEMAPGEGESELEFWVYVSGRCGHQRPRRLVVEVKDSHRGDGHVLVAKVRPESAARARLGTVSFDSDVPGSSDGSRRELHPGQQFELSSTLTVPSTEGLLARQFYAFPEDSEGLFHATTFRGSAMVSESSTSLQGGDDVDVQVSRTTQYRKHLGELKKSREWVLNQRLLWGAIEVPMQVGAGVVAPEVCSVEVTPRVWTARQVIELLRKNIRLESRPARPLMKTGLVATDGYEIVIDEEAFAREYSQRVEKEVCSDDPGGKAVPVRSGKGSYVFRYYTSLDLPDLQPVSPPRERVRLPGKKPILRSEGEPQEDFEFPDLRVDLASGWGLISNLQPKGAPWDPGQVLLWPLLFTSRVSIGSELVGVVDFGVGTGEGINGDGWAVDVATMHAGTGIGYIFDVMAVEVQPRLMVEWSRRIVAIGGAFGTVERSSWGVGLGASGRKALGRFGVHLDASYLVDGDGPLLVSGDDESSIMKGGMWRLVGGLSVIFD